MKLTTLILTGLLITSLTFGQVVKFQAGTSISKIDWIIGNMDMRLNEPLAGYSVFLGLDYMDKRYFNLSSNVGFLRKGGKGTVTFVSETGEPIEDVIQKVKLNYFSINTLVDLKCPIKEKVIPFVSVGPRFDYLLSYSTEIDDLNQIDALKKFNFGLLMGGGLRCDLSKVQIGLRADYYLNFERIAEWPVQTRNLGGKVTDKTFVINLTVGYRLK